MKRLVSAVMAVFLAFSIMSVSVFANDEVDLQAIQDAWFEYTLTNSQHAGHLGSDDWEYAIENDFGYAVDYEAFGLFLKSGSKGKRISIDKVDITNWRDLEKLSDDYDDWLIDNLETLFPINFDDIDDWNYDSEKQQWISEEDDSEYIAEKKNGQWIFSNSEGKIVLTVDTLSKFSYIYENIETDKYESKKDTSTNSSENNSESPAQTRTAANAYEGQRASGTTKASAETASEQQRATTSTTAPAEQDDSNIGIYVVLIVLIITTGVVIIVVNNNKNKNK